MNSEEQLKANIVEHCFGSGEPSLELLNRGTFPANWLSRYLALLQRAGNVWKDRPEWPREVVAAIHFASFYLEIRYEAWLKTSRRDNPATQLALGQIRAQSEMFLLSPVLHNSATSPRTTKSST